MNPLGKSDHYVLSIRSNFNIFNKTFGEQYNYSKGDYANLCNFVDIDWTQRLAQCDDDVEAIWSLFKNHLLEGIDQNIPKVSRFYDWRKPSWKCPLSDNIRAKIKNKHNLWKQYVETRSEACLRKYRKSRLIHKAEQNEVAKAAKTNPKIFWTYVMNKTSIKSTIGDIKTHVNNEDVIISNDDEKASAFCKYFSSVFTVEEDVEDAKQQSSIIVILLEIEFNEYSIYKALDKLNIY